MKHKLLPLLLTSLLLCACSSNATTLTVNDPLSYSVRIKDNAEFILIKEGTSVEEATQIIKDNLDIETNADSYEFDWWGEAYAGYENEEELNEDLEYYNQNKDNNENLTDIETYMDEFGDLELARENTLNHDSLRPIKIILKFNKNNEETTYYKEILLCVARDTEYNVISDSGSKTIESAYNALNRDGSYVSWTYANDVEGYDSNIRNFKD